MNLKSDNKSTIELKTMLTQKNEALKAIHRLCNTALDDGETGNVPLIKKIRAIASEAWPI